MDRRQFLRGAGLSTAASVAALAPGAGLLAGGVAGAAPAREAVPPPLTSRSSWAEVRKTFLLTPKYLHFAGMLFASHPYAVRAAIERHRRMLDENPALVVEPEHLGPNDHRVRTAAARYLGTQPGQIALTDSTTMGLGLIYHGLPLRAGEAVLTTTHDHYSTMEALRFATERSGARLDRVTLYDDGASVSEGEVVRRLLVGVRPETRYVAVTWVHSSTGVKLPIAAISAALGKINAGRREAEQIRLCVDGVHGFGAENLEIGQLGCDFFMAGTHKWILGPRGTGLIWGSERGWSGQQQIIPPFEREPFISFVRGAPTPAYPGGNRLTPGGFHTYEHRWAVAEAFELHLAIGKARIQERIHALASQAKEGLARIKGITLRTPKSPELSSGIVCFEVAGKKPDEVVKALLGKRIIASATPYYTSYARLSTCIFNTPNEVEQVLREIRALT
jgi:selenocysteine lyase/cysteine desulfurase